MLVNEICFVEYIAAILIRQWIMNATLKDARLIVMAEVTQVWLQLALVRHRVETEFAGELVRMNHE